VYHWATLTADGSELRATMTFHFLSSWGKGGKVLPIIGCSGVAQYAYCAKKKKSFLESADVAEDSPKD
jgi:hypothetical protein